MLIEVVIINESTVMSDAELKPIVAALQHQVWHDFRSTWGVTAVLTQLPKGTRPPSDKYWIGIFDTAGQANELGYHDLTPLGFPVGKVFAQTDIEYGAKTSVTLSHELLEILGDPFINLTAYDPHTNRLYAYENCDAVEADELGYAIDGITVSDFVLPQYFDPQHAGKGARLSLQGHVTEPFSLAKGGYLSYLDLHNLSAGWQQETDAHRPEENVRRSGEREVGFPDGSRRERRRRAGILVLSEFEG